MAGERINIIFMRDTGEARRYRMVRSRLRLLLVFFLCMPPLLAVSAYFCWTWWHELRSVEKEYAIVREQLDKAQATASRLTTLQALLRRPEEETVRHMAVAGQRNPAYDLPQSPAEASPDEEGTQSAASDGPGHEAFPVTESGIVALQNVNIRAVNNSRMRITMDIRNIPGKELVTGKVSCQLLTEEGSIIAVKIQPEDAEDFRITRLKRAGFTGQVPQKYSVINGQIIFAVHSDKGDLLYRNIYPIAR